MKPSIEEMEEEYQDHLMVSVALSHLIQDYREKLDGVPRPLPTIYQRWENNIPRCKRLVKEHDAKRTALRHAIMELEGRD